MAEEREAVAQGEGKRAGVRESLGEAVDEGDR